MSTEELIRYLRTVADYGTELTQNDKDVFAQAADRLEELEERVAIMMEGRGSAREAWEDDQISMEELIAESRK